MDPRIVDRIYECSFLPDLWPGVLDELAHVADARGGIFFALKKQSVNWTASDTLLDMFGDYVNGGWMPRCTRGTRIFSAMNPRFSVEYDFWTDEELETNPVYVDFLRPRGLGWCAATTFTLPTGDSLWLSVERDLVKGPVEQSKVEKLNELRPHLARSAMLSARLQLERARATSEMLALIGLPALVFNERGRVLASNDLIEEQDHICWRARDQFSFSDESANVLFRQTLAALAINPNSSGRSFALRAQDGGAASVAHVLPIHGQARDIAMACAGALVMTPVTTPEAPAVELIQSLFDLTPAEAQVARNLTSGDSVEKIASKSGVSRNTVRTHLRRVLEKTGCHRQAEVVALLSGIGK